MQELRGNVVSEGIRKDCLSFLAAHPGILPTLAILRIGEREEDLAYERGVKSRFASFGLEVKDYHLPEHCTDAEFQEVFAFLNADAEIHGILVMRPLPPQIDEAAMIRAFRPEKDLDGITPQNVAGIMMGMKEAFAPCTAEAVIELLKGYAVPLEGKRVVVIGRSMVVGKPLSMLLLRENATVTICHSKTEDLKAVTREADVLVTAIGRARMVGSSYIKEDAVVVDVGINTDKDGKLCGDCDFDTMATRASMLSPVPGGVGTVTTAVLARHLLEAVERGMA